MRTNLHDVSHQGLTTILHGSLIGLAGLVSSTLFSIGLQFFLARSLGPGQLGLFNLGLSVAGLLAVVATFGLDNSVIRLVAGYLGQKDQSRELGAIVSIFILFCAINVFLIPLALIIAPVLAQDIFHKPDLTPVLHLLFLSVPLIVASKLCMSVLQSYKRLEYKAIIDRFLAPAITLVGTVILVWKLGNTGFAAACAIFIGELVGFILSLAALLSFRRLRRYDARPTLIPREALSWALPFALTALVGRTNVQTETLVLGSYSTVSQLGIYTACLRIAGVLDTFLLAINAIFAPAIAELFSKGALEQLSAEFKTVTRWAFTLTLPFTLILIIFSPDVMSLLGPGFSAGIPILRMLALANLIFVGTGPVGYILGMTRYPRINLANVVITLLLSLALDFTLIPAYDIYGAAISGAITIILINLLRLGEVHVLLKMQPYNWAYWKPVVAGVATGLMVFSGSLALKALPGFWRLSIFGLLTIVSFFTILILLGIDKEDQHAIRSFLFQRK